MRSINLYVLTRVCCDAEAFCHYESLLSNRNGHVQIRQHEVDNLGALVEQLLKVGCATKHFDAFYYSYSIPQIGKEFDLLKISSDAVLNIELKSTASLSDATEQLQKNSYYLSHLSRKLHLYSYIQDVNKLYRLSGNQLEEVDFAQLLRVITNMFNCYTGDLNELFKVANFLVSPINTPSRFCNGEYFLTQHQEQIKKSIISSLSSGKSQFYQLEGGAGTGKTLLLYDIAKHFSLNKQVAIIHCGELLEGHLEVQGKINNLTILPISTALNQDLSIYSLVVIDEAQRISNFNELVERLRQSGRRCIFGLDPVQVLSQGATEQSVAEAISRLCINNYYRLSKRVRTNKEVLGFIRALFNPKLGKLSTCKNVEIAYANSESEAYKLIKYYHQSGYVLIHYAPMLKEGSPIEEYLGLTNVHMVIGQEFDKVLMVLDNSFFYQNGKLTAKTDTNYLYTNLLYQGITRVREQLALIILNNQPLFNQVLSIISK